jgi:hypothetical protein
MALKSRDDVEISEDLLDAIRSFPVEREVEHCGSRIKISPFEFYADCPQCGSRQKLRSFSAVPEIEDVFDAIFEWLDNPEARRIADQRREALRTESDND